MDFKILSIFFPFWPPSNCLNIEWYGGMAEVGERTRGRGGDVVYFCIFGEPKEVEGATFTPCSRLSIPISSWREFGI